MKFARSWQELPGRTFRAARLTNPPQRSKDSASRDSELAAGRGGFNGRLPSDAVAPRANCITGLDPKSEAIFDRSDAARSQRTSVPSRDTVEAALIDFCRSRETGVVIIPWGMALSNPPLGPDARFVQPRA
jgi:hypothetical protein